ncbi:two-component system histidine kinase PnpS [Caldinitratiruptor microaerophilus]|nr:phosphate regulon sensor histidine kinase PhoR [Caldinitratiruptor microaerophilus]
MNGIRRQAVLYAVVPLLAMLALAAWQLARWRAAGPGGMAVLFLVLAIGAVPALWGLRMSGQVATALAEAAAVLRRLAQGDFSRSVLPAPGDPADVRDLAEQVNRMSHRLQAYLEALGRESLRLEAVLATMAEGVVILDARRRIVLLNPAAEALFGITLAEARGRDHLEVTHNFDLEARLERLLAGGPPEVFELRRAHPEERVLEGRLVGLARAGEGPAGALLVLHDITRFRRLERMRTEFVANVSHELRTPLTSIRGFAETLLEADPDPETRRRFLEIVHREASRLSDLIEDLLDLSRIESGRMAMRPGPVAVDVLVADVLDRHQRRARAAELTLESRVPPGLPPVWGDRARLAQVLHNLVDNAIRYTPPGGRVTVAAEANPEGFVTVSVADTGIGIAREHLPRLFERFYRVDRARSRSSGGTGLGLSIVKHIVELHGGAVSVESEPGRGSTFRFSVPVAGPRTAASQG